MCRPALAASQVADVTEGEVVRAVYLGGTARRGGMGSAEERAVRLFTLFALTVLATGCNGRLADERLQPPPGPAQHGTVMEPPPSLTAVVLPEQGRASFAPALPSGAPPLRVACGTCHATAPERPLPAKPEQLQQFHQGLAFKHGALECASCHSVGQPPRLHLATGEALETSEALKLCAQCHGPQWRDFQRGAHGGIRGYWDASRGPKERIHCVNCHDPHAPRYVGGQPVLPPRDRLLEAHPQEAQP